MSIRDRIRGLKTITASGAVAIAGAVLSMKDEISAAGLDLKSVVGDWIPAKDVGVVMVGIACMFALLRVVTTTPVFKDKPDA